MYLKKLELYGFKSFANKIEMNFDQGVTGVVGPNGSGKSNISDGIKWVLGEQSVKTLRGSKMEDVIFAGTSNRKPLGMSEVSLTLDNSSQLLPIEYEEVTITRRMYRSGESEYYLNKSACRLKDIRELLMDTGIGKDGYSIIGQGKIDEILSSKSEDRRQLFEEAAGIIKYKHRKNDAEKKLTTTKDNLIRVTDILQELENQLEPLKKQSIKAQKYSQLRETLIRLEVNLFIKEIDKIDEELKHVHEQMEMLQKSLSTQEIEKKNHVKNFEKIQEQIDLNEEETANHQNDFYKVQQEIGKKEGEISVNQEKLLHYNENIARLNSEVSDIKTIITNHTKDLEDKLQHLKTVDIELEDLERKVQKQVLKYQGVNQLKTLKEEDIEKSKSFIIETLNDISDKKSESNSLKTLIQTMEQRIQQINKEIQDLESKNEEGHRKLNDLQQNLNQLQMRLKERNKAIELTINNKTTMERESKELNKKIEKIKGEIQHKRSKKNLIEEMEREHDGYNKSVKNILTACKKDNVLGKDVYGVVANLLKVSKGYEVALETALGFSIQNIVTKSEEDAKRLISYLKRHNLGRVTFLPITAMQKKFINQEEMKIIKGFSNVKTAIDVINYDTEFINVFSNLLSRVLIVPDLDIGVKIAKALNYRFKIVTIAGDVLNIGGSLTGGSSALKGNSILGRKRELEELSEAIEFMDKDYKVLQEKSHKATNTINKLDEELKELNEKQQEERIQEATIISKIQQAEEENNQTTNYIKLLNREKIELKKAEEETLVKFNIIGQEVKLLEEKITNTKQILVDYEENLLKGKQEIENLNDEITKDKINLASMKEQKKALLHEIVNLQETIKTNEMQILQKNEEIKKSNQEYNNLEDELLKNKKQLENLLLNISKSQRNIEKLRDSKQNLIQLQKQSKEMLNQVEIIVKDLNEGAYKLDVKCTRLEMQQQTFYNKLWEEYELTYNNAKDMQEDISDHTNVAKEIKTLKDGIKALGHINLESIEEYEKIKERYEFLHQQKDDLEKARQALLKVIKEMETIMEKQFLQEFAKIKKNFNEVFIKLFGGGKGQLVLEDEENILNCGIEIIAQPPGKKLQNLSLLSGGERALTAISLLFGILLVKPSPFCVLDEIEAALDDANVTRFAKFLQELSCDTQFIVVTHRKGTMECTDALYGVTMEEEGISKIVSVKFTDDMDKEIAS
ncbi:condensin subunit Smc [Natronincola peptidivorans]|uniref:Chromosome partition protein Smc n=1 Tax=Natronincola peptidivorans TaxID=426128 RepID=A0A1H9YD18_9FIRM|nr:chromosome segregation protein SMC [Natronincola peptidivorans]SES66820.1 condensin subunit Smc [Natronincola peptidivorans]